MLKLVSKDYIYNLKRYQNPNENGPHGKKVILKNGRYMKLKNEFEPQEECYVQDYYQLKLEKKYAELY